MLYCERDLSISLNEAEYIARAQEAISIWYEADTIPPTFLALSQDGSLTVPKLLSTARRHARLHGYALTWRSKGISPFGGKAYVKFMLIALPATRITPQMRPLRDKLQGDRHLLAYPAERTVGYYEHYLQVLIPFLAAFYNQRKRRYIQTDEDAEGTTNTLFRAGFLQRSNLDPHYYRPTVAGVQWYRRASDYLDNRPKQVPMFTESTPNEAAYAIW